MLCAHIIVLNVLADIHRKEWKDDGDSSDDYDYSISDYDEDAYGDDDDDDNHQFQANLSDDLRRLLGLDVPSKTGGGGGQVTGFMPPQFHGLENSARKSLYSYLIT